MTPIQLIVLPYVASGQITAEQGDKAYAILGARLAGESTDNTSVSYLDKIVREAINTVKEKKK